MPLKRNSLLSYLTYLLFSVIFLASFEAYLAVPEPFLASGLGYFLPFFLLWLVMKPSLPAALTDNCKGSSSHLFRCLLFPVILPFLAFCLLQCEITAEEVGSATFKSADDTWHPLSLVIKN